MSSEENNSKNLKQNKETNDVQKASKNRTREEENYLELLKKASDEIFPITTDLVPNTQWPLECQVLDERIKHIYYVPVTPESYYVPNGKEARPKPFRHKRGKIVYEYSTNEYVSFHRSCTKGNSFNVLNTSSDSEDVLKFESRFESGNLAKAVKINDNYYELYLRNDLYTYKQKQWFYFRINNMKKDINYRFSIINMTKKENLFNEGMKPLMYSVKDATLHKTGWKRRGENICYFCNEELDDSDHTMSYTLTFTIDFPYENDTVYLAYSYPYTYSDLIDYLNKLSQDPVSSKYVTIRTLCKTVAGNDAYYVTIDDPPPKTISVSKERCKKISKNPHSALNHKEQKNAIIITARVHSGETPSSWMMKGFLDFLTSDIDTAKALRKKFVFYLVPMLNPDGVIVGNTRCSLIGKDLNGEFKNATRQRSPTIWYLKLLVERMLKKRGVTLYCDLHAQYSMSNIYIYGCGNCKRLNSQFNNESFPSVIQKNALDKFSFESSKLNNEKSKEGTGRITLWTMGIANSFTIEASFGGSSLGDRAKTHFTTQDYEEMAYSFCHSILEFYFN